MSKKALIIGINNYKNMGNLNGCEIDAQHVSEILSKNADRSPNFDVELLTTTEEYELNASKIRMSLAQLFENNDGLDTCLFYFAGHGMSSGGQSYICTPEADENHFGVSFSEVMNFVKGSRAKNNVVILDSCSSGGLGRSIFNEGISKLPEGTTILTACEENKYSIEDSNGGVFTNLMIDALDGGAGNILGEVTASSIYSYIDQSLGNWDQRPIFKTNVKNFSVIRTASAHVTKENLYDLISLFPTKDHEYLLDPTFEPDLTTEQKEKFGMESDPDNVTKFQLLQEFNRVNLILPTNEKHMYYAAINSKSCHLTRLGKHYWDLVKQNRV